jgi:hypothetical protein
LFLVGVVAEDLLRSMSLLSSSAVLLNLNFISSPPYK